MKLTIKCEDLQKEPTVELELAPIDRGRVALRANNEVLAIIASSGDTSLWLNPSDPDDVTRVQFNLSECL